MLAGWLCGLGMTAGSLGRRHCVRLGHAGLEGPLTIIDSIRGEYVRYKALAEAAIAQLDADQLSFEQATDSNSVVVICWHLSGNLKSRFSDFLTSDGEKPWRNREEEFVPRTVTRAELLVKWADGWYTLFAALVSLRDDQLSSTITIRQQPLVIHEALHRSLAHTAYHVGQIVYIAKTLRGAQWRSLSIPKGQSDTYNQRPASEKPAAHAATLGKQNEGNAG
jgi:hypothetical protein